MFCGSRESYQESTKESVVETVRDFTYRGDRVSAGGGCEAAVTARTRCGSVKLRECVELLYGRRFPLMLKWAVYSSYVRSAILYGSEACCLKESEMGILRRTERSMVRAMCRAQLKDRKRSMDLMFIQHEHQIHRSFSIFELCSTHCSHHGSFCPS